jgi:type II secretory pathway component GspD/PulD (secretin)
MIGFTLRTRSHLLMFTVLLSPIFPTSALVSAADTPVLATEPTPPAEVDTQPDVTAAERIEVPGVAAQDITRRSPSDVELVFNFSGAEWREVIQWIADEAGLSLQADRYPQGTVNYVDNSRSYRLGEAMDEINRLLLDRGFSLVRRGRQLILIDQESDNAASLISELAELVSAEELDTRANSDIVRCVFALGSLSADAAKVEIGQLIGPAGKVIVLESAKQVVVTETVSRLKAIRSLLANASAASSDVTEIVLKHRVADELLEIARPLIGLESGANSSDKIRIAIGLYGDRLYATGEAATRALLERIIERADTPLQMNTPETGESQSLPKLETYIVSTVAPSTVIDVLQTLLAGLPDTRLTIDPQAGGIIAYARPETHLMIQQTIDKLEGRGSTFEIIQLRRLEPSQALATINKFFGATDGSKKDVPTIDGDPATGRLWVRGTTEQIAMVRNLIEKLEGTDSLGDMGDRIRVLPYTGRTAQETVEQLQSLWQVMGKKNKIRMVTPSAGGGSASRNTFPQRRVGGMIEAASGAGVPDTMPTADRIDGGIFPDEARRRKDSLALPDPNELTLVSDTTATAATAAAEKIPDGSGDIVITMTPGGMVIASDDPLALSDFEQMMRTLSDQTSMAGAEPTVFWLKYTKAPEAADLITKILGGDSGGGGGGGLASSMLGELGGGMLGGLLGFGGGGDSGGSTANSILTTSGSVSIVADGRLNALIVQANAVDMQTIEMILEVIDREESPEDVRTTSKPQLIPVIYQSAADVANIVKAVYAERSGEQGGGRGGQQQMSSQDLINAIRGGGGGGRGGRGGGNEQATKPAPVIIAVDTRSNSLIVTAPPQDVEDIRELVEAIDAGGMQSEETVEIVSLKGTVKPEVVQQALDSILGVKSKTSTANASAASAGAPTPTGGGDNASAEDIQRRIEFFRQMRERGGFGGAPGGGGPPGGGAAPGGFGGGTRGGTGTGGGDAGRTRGRGGR